MWDTVFLAFLTSFHTSSFEEAYCQTWLNPDGGSGTGELLGAAGWARGIQFQLLRVELQCLLLIPFQQMTLKEVLDPTVYLKAF